MYSFFLFDLDGTLSDPLPGIARSFNYALAHFGYRQLPLTDFGRYIGPPLDVSFQALTGVNEPAALLALVAKFRERYGEIGYSENQLYPGIREALAGLAGQGVAMAVCTAKRQDLAEKVLDLFAIQQHFQFVSGGDVGIHKWQQIAALLAEGAINLQSVMIGDRDADLIAASKNGLAGAGVLWGYGSRAELQAHSPACLLTQPSELLQLVDRTERPENLQ